MRRLLSLTFLMIVALLAAACAPTANSTAPLTTAPTIVPETPTAESAAPAEAQPVTAARPRFIDSFANW